MKSIQNLLITLLFISTSVFSQSSTTVYAEEFSSTGNWPTGSNSTRELSVYNGRYYFDHKRKDKSWRISTREFELNTFQDFELETSIQKISGVDNYGMTFMYDFKDENNYRELAITSGGFFRVAESVNGTYKNIKPWTESSTVKKGNYATNDLKVTKKGSTITFYINGSYMYSMTHKSFLGKKMAITLYRNQKISIDYLRAKQLSSSTNNFASTTTILFEGFNDNKNNWSEKNDQNVELAVTNGDYIFNHKRNERGWNSTIDKYFDTSRNFSITAQIKKVSGVLNNGFGIIFGRKDNDNQNQFFISGDGSFIIKKTENGKDTYEKNWTKSSYIKTGNGVYNYLKVDRVGNTLKFYINDNWVHTSYSVNMFGTRTGFIVFNNQKIAVGYLSMKYTDSKNSINNNNNNNFNKDLDVVFNEDFSNNSNNWSTSSNQNIDFYVSYGKYYVEHKRKEKGWLTHVNKPFDSTKDFEIETEIEHISGDTNSPYGIIWGKKDTNYYQFLLAATGYYKITRVINNKSEDIVKWEKTSVVKGTRNPNTLKITREGNYYKFYINGSFVTKLDYEAFFGDEIGYIVYYNQKIAVDFLRVKKTKSTNNNTYIADKNLSVPLRDDFNSNTSKWIIEDATNYSVDMQNSQLLITRKTTGGIFISRNVDLNTSKDFIIETAIRQKNVSDGFYGVTFGRKNSSNEFSFLLSGNGSYKYRKFDNNNYKEIIPSTFSSAIKTNTNDQNIIKIVKSGSLLRFYINGIYINETPFEPFYGNQLGYTVYYNRKIAVDYLDIKYQTNSYNDPPVVVITEPDVELKRGFKIVEAKRILVKGKATDVDGIFEITVNGIEASVSDDGSFVANVPLKYGKNDLIVKATDLKQASSTKEFVIKRSSPEIDNTINEVVDKTEKLDIGFGKYYALLIGVSEYDDETIVDLGGEPTKDAQALADVLVSHYNFSRENVIVLKNPKDDDIIKQFFLLKNKVGKNDNLVIFYAGHGNYDKVSERGYWMPSNANMEFEGNVILNTSIVSYIKAIESKHTLLISDACFSGSILTRNRDYSKASKAVQTKYSLPSRKAITSGALETVPNKSVFMKYLLKRLKENNNTYLSAGQLFNMIEDPVINNLDSDNKDNKPLYAPISRTGDEGGDFIFIKRN